MKKSIPFVLFTIWTFIIVYWQLNYLFTSKHLIPIEAKVNPPSVGIFLCLYIYGFFKRNRLLYIFIFELFVIISEAFIIFVNSFGYIGQY